MLQHKLKDTRSFWKMLDEKGIRDKCDLEMIPDLEYFIHEFGHFDDLDINAYEDGFGYEYGSISGYESLGMQVEAAWDGEGKGPEINHLLSMISDEPDKLNKYELEIEGDRDQPDITVMLDLSDVDIEMREFQFEGKWNFKYYKRKWETKEIHGKERRVRTREEHTETIENGKFYMYYLKGTVKIG